LLYFLFFPVLGLRFGSSYLSSRDGTASRPPPRTFFAGLKLSKNFFPALPSSLPIFSGRKRVQNYSFFPYKQDFFHLFFKKFSLR
jgi:hypothetical protein